MNEKKSNINEETEEKSYALYTEKIVQSPKEKYKKYISGLRVTGIVSVIAILLFVFIRFIVPWYGDNFPKKQEKKDELMIQKDEYSDNESGSIAKDGNGIEGGSRTDLDIEDYETVMDALRARVAEVQKSVVSIYLDKKDVSQIGTEGADASETCGLVIGTVNSEYMILTKSSAIGDSENVVIQFSTGEEITGRVSGRDSRTDMAVIIVNATEMSYTMMQSIKVATLDNSYNVHQGDLFVTYGKLYGQNKAVDYGTISEISDRVSSDNTFEIFSTSLIYSEDDYSFIFNTAGNIIGISTKSSGKNMKIMGISDMKSIIESLVNRGGSPYFGIQGRSVTETMVTTYGLPLGIYIEEVDVDSPAYDAGLQAGDVIYGIDGNSVLTIRSFSEKLYQCTEGQNLNIKAMRKGKDGYYEVIFHVTVKIV